MAGPGGDPLRPQTRMPWAREWPDLRPVTIVRLEQWVALAVEPDQVPPDVSRPGFLERFAGPRGTGETPDAAYLDLARRQAQE